jgi:cell division protease FtsH
MESFNSFLATVPNFVWAIVGVAAFLLFLNIWQKRMRARNGGSGGYTPPPSNRNTPRSGGGLDQQFTRSAARKFEPTDVGGKTFADVAGCEEAIRKLRRVQRWLKSRTLFDMFDARLPKGVLLVGPPGTGKTLLAKALAGEAGASFFSISGSQFVEMYVGVGASRVRDLFNEARAEVARTKKPVIIFIDEIDAVGRQRSGPGSMSSHDERDQTLNEILVQMDGFAPNQGIMVLAATNRVDILDAALKRPGRFDYQVLVDLPDLAGREAIFKIHTKKKPLSPGMDCRLLAARTPGFSGADIEAVANEAATLAAERVEAEVAKLRAEKASEQEINAKVVRAIKLEEFDEAVDIVQMGEARVSRAHAMSKEDMRQTAYHEVGHAVVMKARNGDPITKITIVPRARALGYTQSLPEGDRFNMTDQQIRTRIMMAMGGRVAQEVFCNTVDTGASNDFKQASGLARRMVTEFGMTDLGPIHIDDQELQSLGGGFFGPAMKDQVNAEWQRILKECKDEARKIIEENRDRIERITAVLLEKETILGPEFLKLWEETPAGGSNSTAL